MRNHDGIDIFRLHADRGKVGEQMPAIGTQRLRRTRLDQDLAAAALQQQRIQIELVAVQRKERIAQCLAEIIRRRAVGIDAGISGQRAVADDGGPDIADPETVMAGIGASLPGFCANAAGGARSGANAPAAPVASNPRRLMPSADAINVSICCAARSAVCDQVHLIAPIVIRKYHDRIHVMRQRM